MKKRILIILTLLLFTTGCTCEYNLTIDGNVYKEEVTLIGENINERTNFNKEWKIPVDKDEYNIGGDTSTDIEYDKDTYEYKLSGNNLVFKYDFTKNEYPNSSAVSNCYNKLTVSDYSDSIIISSSPSAICFDRYPTLNSLVINIHVDKPVISNNADMVNGNTYTWNLSRSNASNKSINLVLNNQANDSPSSSQNAQIERQNSSSDYTLYIFSGLLLIVMLSGYALFNKMKNKNNQMDD